MIDYINTIIQGDCLQVLQMFPDESVHCVITSPPYWGLRDYGIDGQLGLEATPEEYVTKMVEIFREVRRMLRVDGTLWLNMGDSYATSGSGSGQNNAKAADGEECESFRSAKYLNQRNPKTAVGTLKPKDLCGMPWRVAFALQADGWWLRQDIIWNKSNPMPESVRDRCTKAHEYLFLLTKSKNYYYDKDAIREPSITDRDSKASMMFGSPNGKNNTPELAHAADLGHKWEWTPGRNKRSVWTIPTKPYPEAHFATFPPKLIEPCILAGTSEKGCCPECGSPWERVVESKYVRPETRKSDPNIDRSRYNDQDKINVGYRPEQVLTRETETIGWKPGCGCIHGIGDYTMSSYEPVPCIVLDPFIGSGTTGAVATQHRRNWIGIELNPEYIKQGMKRTNGITPMMEFA